MFYRLLRWVNKDQKGITGLETAIILIAFVMVASVLAYVVLSAGLFSSQKAREAVHTGLEEVRSTMELKGNVLAKMEDGFVTEVYLTIGSYGASQPIDFTDTTEGKNKVVISYGDNYQQFPNLDWTLTKLNTAGEDSLLDPTELFLITVDLSEVNDGAASDDEKIGPYHKFTLEVKPPVGAVLTVERTVPAKVSQMVNLY